MSKKFSTKTVDILSVVRSALWDMHEGKIIQAYELLSEMYDSVSEQITENKIPSDKLNAYKSCSDCEYDAYNINTEPCFSCHATGIHEAWKPKEV